jgi:S-DNA-T family DNA segregation ATPase FtsK/SpoIIIE
VTLELSVSEVRQALRQALGREGAGNGEPANVLVGQIFHEVFADLVGADAERSGFPLLVDAHPDQERAKDQLLRHAYRRLLGPRLVRHRSSLNDTTEPVLLVWRAVQELVQWLVPLGAELIRLDPEAETSWERLASVVSAEVPVECVLCEPTWSDPVRLVGIADSLLKVPERAAWCAVELKLGRACPPLDLGQAALYHLILKRTGAASASSALALLRFTPELDETLVRADELGEAERRLLDLIGALAGTKPGAAAELGPRGAAPAGASPGSPPRVQSSQEAAPATPPEAHLALRRRLMHAFREYGVAVELGQTPLVGPRFLRFDLRLGSATRIDAVRRALGEVQIRAELRREPLLVRELGRLSLDVERPDPVTVPFSAIVDQLPAPGPRGSSRVPVGVSASGQLHCADLASSGRSHVLVAGTTGSGKSEWLRMMLAGLLVSNTPETLRIVTLDPKLVAFAELEKSPFLMSAEAWWIPGSGRDASEVFEELAAEMDARYATIHAAGADHLGEFVEKTGRMLPRIVCVCDEYFALISAGASEKKRIEAAIFLLGAKGRAAGVHLVLATQQPSRRVIQGALDTNLPCRVGLLTAKAEESRMLLGVTGAEQLTGAGDLLYKDFGEPVRLQAPYLGPSERGRWLGRGSDSKRGVSLPEAGPRSAATE